MAAPAEGNGIDRIHRDISPEVSVLLLMLCKPRKFNAARVMIGNVVGGRCVRHSRAGPWSRRGNRINRICRGQCPHWPEERV